MSKTPRGVTLDQLSTFLLVAKTGTFTQTAKKLNVNQSTVSRTLQKLETFLGVRLFEREGNNLILSSAGLKIQAKAQAIADSVDSLIAEAREFQGCKTHGLRFASSVSFSRAISPFLVNALIGSIPDIATFSGNTPEVIGMLQKGFVDIAVATTSMAGFSEFTSRVLYREKYLLILPREVEHVISSKQELVEYASDHPCIQFHRQTQDWLHTSRVLRQLGVNNWTISLSTIESIIQLVEREKYWSLMPAVNIWGANRDLSKVTYKFLFGQQGYRTLYLLYREEYFSPIADEIASVVKIALEQELIPKFSKINLTLGTAVEWEGDSN
jgi:DNA-binding transcriptional LysR family regulator